ncbi:MAG: sigma 54-interacting transcriptional regulator, partial [Sedimentisphaerales bacterium]|nr:sigma 54-interacting transcriptional regulator [Sedimentisphaerales bacterium]
MQALAREVSREIFVADDLAEAIEMVDLIRPDLVVFDEHTLPDDVRVFLAKAGAIKGVPVIVVDKGTRQMEDGGTDLIEYIPSDCSPQLLKEVVARIIGQVKDDKLSDLQSYFVDPSVAEVGMVGRSEAAKEEFRLIRLVAASQCNPVLIVGETGTGKELAAM